MIYPKLNGRGKMAAILLSSVLACTGASAEPIIFRGQFVYVVPEDMGDKMTELASKNNWKLYSQYTRFIDTDEDGKADFVAVALGAPGGYGAQIRYRFNREGENAEPRLGLWYWCVITNETGQKIFEEFNP